MAPETHIRQLGMCRVGGKHRRAQLHAGEDAGVQELAPGVVERRRREARLSNSSGPTATPHPVVLFSDWLWMWGEGGLASSDPL